MKIINILLYMKDSTQEKSPGFNKTVKKIKN